MSEDTNVQAYVTNKTFAAQDTGFRAACDAVGLTPSKRQASKWRMGKGSAKLGKEKAGKSW